MKVLHQPITLHYCTALFVLIFTLLDPIKFSSILTLVSLRLLYLCGASEGIDILGSARTVSSGRILNQSNW